MISSLLRKCSKSEMKCQDQILFGHLPEDIKIILIKLCQALFFYKRL